MDEPNINNGVNKGWANLRPPQPGEVRNPNGRPRKGNAWADIITEYLDSSTIEHVVTTTNKATGEKKTHKFVVDGEGKSIRKLLVARLIHDARNGDKKAFDILMDREYGKPKQAIEINKDDDVEGRFKQLAELMGGINTTATAPEPDTDTR